MPAPRIASEPIGFVFGDDNKGTSGLQRPVIPQNETPHAHKTSQWALEEIVGILLEDGHVQSGVWAVVPSEICDTGGDLAAELCIPILDLGPQTLQKIRRLLHQDGFAKSGILVLKMDPSGDGHDEVRGMEDIQVWI